MMLFRVTNGYTGFGDVHVICVAESEERALKAAREKIKANVVRTTFSDGKPIYSSSYYKNLTAELLCPDISGGFCSEVYD